jgi:two-component system phosphate regulon sensor histidine kinase PhoR
VHSAQDSSIDLEFEYTDDVLVIEMKDTRPHIPEDQLGDAFHPFYVPSQGSHIHTGLELTIIRHIVDMHHGDISIKNRAGKIGTVLRVELPL